MTSKDRVEILAVIDKAEASRMARGRRRRRRRGCRSLRSRTTYPAISASLRRRKSSSRDMANRLAANRNHASSYVTATGTGATCPTSTSSTADIDLGEWCKALQGDNVKKAGVSVVVVSLDGATIGRSSGGAGNEADPVVAPRRSNVLAPDLSSGQSLVAMADNRSAYDVTLRSTNANQIVRMRLTRSNR